MASGRRTSACISTPGTSCSSRCPINWSPRAPRCTPPGLSDNPRDRTRLIRPLRPEPRAMFIDPERYRLTRRAALCSPLAAALPPGVAGADTAQPDSRRAAPRRFGMKKSINLWAFPYPERMTLRECLQLARDAGFDGIELNYDLDNDLSPKAQAKDLRAIRKMAEDIGIAISGVCSFLFWPYSLTSNNATQRARGIELAGLMLRAAHELG